MSGPDDPAVKLWMAYAQRVAVGACIATIRIERFRKPRLETEPLRRTCLQYRPPKAPPLLYRELGIPMPKADWRPGGDF